MYEDEWFSGFSTRAAPRFREMIELELDVVLPG
jgi:hypothetical protein